jgi:hypothetical protein
MSGCNFCGIYLSSDPFHNMLCFLNKKSVKSLYRTCRDVKCLIDVEQVMDAKRCGDFCRDYYEKQYVNILKTLDLRMVIRSSSELLLKISKCLTFRFNHEMNPYFYTKHPDYDVTSDVSNGEYRIRVLFREIAPVESNFAQIIISRDQYPFYSFKTGRSEDLQLVPLLCINDWILEWNNTLGIIIRCLETSDFDDITDLSVLDNKEYQEMSCLLLDLHDKYIGKEFPDFCQTVLTQCKIKIPHCISHLLVDFTRNGFSCPILSIDKPLSREVGIGDYPLNKHFKIDRLAHKIKEYVPNGIHTNQFSLLSNIDTLVWKRFHEDNGIFGSDDWDPDDEGAGCCFATRNNF